MDIATGTRVGVSDCSAADRWQRQPNAFRPHLPKTWPMRSPSPYGQNPIGLLTQATASLK
jgi:hypothetical protein